MNPAALAQRIEREQAELAQEALARPAARDSFEYGRVVGIHAGLELAKELILKWYRDEEERTFNL